MFLYLASLLGLQIKSKGSMILPSLGKESNSIPTEEHIPLLFNQYYGKWCILGSRQGSAQEVVSFKEKKNQ